MNENELERLLYIRNLAIVAALDGPPNTAQKAVVLDAMDRLELSMIEVAPMLDELARGESEFTLFDDAVTGDALLLDCARLTVASENLKGEAFQLCVGLGERLNYTPPDMIALFDRLMRAQNDDTDTDFDVDDLDDADGHADAELSENADELAMPPGVAAQDEGLSVQTQRLYDDVFARVEELGWNDHELANEIMRVVSGEEIAPDDALLHLTWLCFPRAITLRLESLEIVPMLLEQVQNGEEFQSVREYLLETEDAFGGQLRVLPSRELLEADMEALRELIEASL